MNNHYITQQSYDHKRDKVDHKAIKADPKKYGYTEQALELKTVPGQSVSVKELIQRYETGRPLPQE